MSRFSACSFWIIAALAACVFVFGRTARQAARAGAAPAAIESFASNAPPVVKAAAMAKPAAVTGPWAEIRGRAGFWRIAEDRDGVWWFLSPDNRREFLNGVTTVQPTLAAFDPNGIAYRSADWDGRLDPGGLDTWADAAVRRVRSFGFKSLGAWCSPALHRRDIPMTRDLNVTHWVAYDSMLFSPSWRAEAESAIRDQAAPLRDNRNLIGYYIDNELNWNDDAVGPRVFFDDLPPEDPNRRAVCDLIRGTWPTVIDFNRDWHTSLNGWDELDHDRRLPTGSHAAWTRLDDRWLRHVAETYFRITTSLIRKYDPNHLILGCRYRGWAPEPVARASRGYTDAQSLNYYAADGLLDADTFGTISRASGQPLIVSEYSFHALDGRSGDRDRSGFPARVRDQDARAAGYRLMTRRLAQVPYVIGADWFQWMDEPPGGRRGDREDANVGIVDVHDRPYAQLVRAVRETTPVLNSLHAAATNAGAQMVWRAPARNSNSATAFAGGQDLIAK